MFRRIVSALLFLTAIAFSFGLVAAPPANVGAGVILTGITVIMAIGAFYVWPRSDFHVPDDLFMDRTAATKTADGPVPSRFGNGDVTRDMRRLGLT
ncbi:hypothetical protein ASD50_07700 [Mesorhizobium sp. Root552]|uniref:hypothetical protein n=1 Tax=Mesorhizobium sp. Root552 TaxID=1736555 RepID=UPI0006FB1798|nr:hypothetical protein [Mesorhizobium sp. Root552]KQZ19359.1 hypothetical protein ASD50_07700 [Mesorhizobium sp. Root552]